MAIGVASLAAAACGGSHASDPVEIASVAVRANPSLELVAADEKQGVLTVRVKRTGQILVVKASDVTAGTAFRDLDAGGAVSVESGSAGSGAAGAEPGGANVASGSQRVSVSSGGRGVSVQAPGQGGVSIGLDGAGGISVSRSGQAAAAPKSSAASAPAPAPAQSSASASTAGGATVDDARLQKRTRQIVCNDDSMKLDGVLLNLNEVAVVVTGDCDLKITNSHIIGTTAISADSNATVSIVNTVLEGRSVAVSLTGNATLAARSSTVHGRVQRTQNTELHDQGGNVWK